MYAALTPNSSIPSTASRAPIIRQCGSSVSPDAPRVLIDPTECTQSSGAGIAPWYNIDCLFSGRKSALAPGVRRIGKWGTDLHHVQRRQTSASSHRPGAELIRDEDSIEGKPQEVGVIKK